MDDSWLQSDGSILGKKLIESHEQGMLWKVQLPNGEWAEAVLAKADAQSAIAFCNLVRNQWHEWKDEQEAKAHRERYDNHSTKTGSDRAGPSVSVPETATQAPETVLGLGIPSRETVNDSLSTVSARISALGNELAELAKQEKFLLKIKEMLNEDAPKDDAEERTSVRSDGSGGQEAGMVE